VPVLQLWLRRGRWRFFHAYSPFFLLSLFSDEFLFWLLLVWGSVLSSLLFCWAVRLCFFQWIFLALFFRPIRIAVAVAAAAAATESCCYRSAARSPLLDAQFETMRVTGRGGWGCRQGPRFSLAVCFFWSARLLLSFGCYYCCWLLCYCCPAAPAPATPASTAVTLHATFSTNQIMMLSFHSPLSPTPLSLSLLLSF